MAVDSWVVHSPAVNYCSSKRRPFAWQDMATRGPWSLNFDRSLQHYVDRKLALQYMLNFRCQTVYAAPTVVTDQQICRLSLDCMTILNVV